MDVMDPLRARPIGR